jgi:hypothetical protein
MRGRVDPGGHSADDRDADRGQALGKRPRHTHAVCRGAPRPDDRDRLVPDGGREALDAPSHEQNRGRVRELVEAPRVMRMAPADRRGACTLGLVAKLGRIEGRKLSQQHFALSPCHR